jgi:hypothetical protein
VGGNYLSRADFGFRAAEITHQHIAIRRDSGLSKGSRRAAYAG